MSAPRTPHRLAAVAASAAVLLLAATACGSSGQSRAEDSNSTSPHQRAHKSPSKPTPTGSSSPAGTSATVPVYYLGDTRAGVRLFREFHRVQGDRLTAALGLAVKGGADDPDYRTGWPHGTSVRGASTDRRTVTVDLSGTSLTARPSGATRAEARQALNALVFTADGVTQSNTPVAFKIDGTPADTVLGVKVGPALARANPDKVKSSMSVFSPAQGATVSSPFEVTGEAATFEAEVVWELMAGGKVVRHGFTTAKECCTLSPYSFKVKAPPGRYTLVVHDTDTESGMGDGTARDTKDVTVR